MSDIVKNNIPTPEDVAAHIEKYGQWGALPKVDLCDKCRFPRTPGTDCVACNDPAAE